MDKVVAVIRKLFFAAKIMLKAAVAPVACVCNKSVKGEPISLPLLGFAAWRLVVWVSFFLCVFGSVGVPAVIANIFLVDLIAVGFQTVFFAVA